MAKRRFKKQKHQKSSESEVNSSNAKLVLFIFGLGPITLLWFLLASKGFFS